MLFVVQPIHSSKCCTNVYVSILQSHGSVFWCYRMLGLQWFTYALRFNLSNEVFLDDTCGCREAEPRCDKQTLPGYLSFPTFGSDTMQFQLIFRCKASTAKTSTAFVKVAEGMNKYNE